MSASVRQPKKTAFNHFSYATKRTTTTDNAYIEDFIAELQGFPDQNEGILETTRDGEGATITVADLILELRQGTDMALGLARSRWEYMQGGPKCALFTGKGHMFTPISAELCSPKWQPPSCLAGPKPKEVDAATIAAHCNGNYKNCMTYKHWPE